MAAEGENLNLEITFRQEYVEDEHPKGDLVYPVQSPESYMRVSASVSNKILVFLAGMSIICLGALVVAPIPIVQGAAGVIWLGSLKFAHQMLRSGK